MPLETVRFLHAAGARIDHQLRDLDLLPDDLRPVVEQATTTAFERMIAAAVEHAVDFVLLAGNSFEASDRSLRARVVLLSGLQQLAEYGIPVFLVPGAGDPANAWEGISGLPENVTVFADTASDPADLRSGEACLATIAPARCLATGLLGFVVRRREFANASDSEGRRYFALGGARRTLTLPDGVGHAPGDLQGIGVRDIGPRGCTLVEMAADGEFRRTFLPMASVRRERLTVEIDPGMSWDELRGRMQNMLAQRAPEIGEEVWLIEWRARGRGPLLERLADQGLCRALAEELEWDAALERDVRVHHAIEPLQESPQWQGLEASDSLRGEFLAALAAAVEPQGRFALDGILSEPALQARLKAAAVELEPESILSHSRRLGLAWFDGPLEGPGA